MKECTFRPRRFDDDDDDDGVSDGFRVLYDYCDDDDYEYDDEE